MRRIAVLLLAVAVFAGAASLAYAEFKKFNVYTEKTAKDNHYTPSGWMGDYGDIKVDTGCKDAPHSGVTCIKVTYSAEQKQGAGWAGRSRFDAGAGTRRQGPKPRLPGQATDPDGCATRV